jgi:SAM-dependent methyltransferase
MKNLVRRSVNKINKIFWEAGSDIKKTSNSQLADQITYRVVSETILNNESKGKKPNEVFYGISDDFWFWLNTEGVRRNSTIRDFLPALPDEATQLLYTALKGDAALHEAFGFYLAFKEQYKKHKGEIKNTHSVLDFGCGWGRIIRFFIKDFQATNIWGCDPVPGMIELCKEQNIWCNFETIDTAPPTSFLENQFDAIYSYSVFSHLSEEMHLNILTEIKRILKPGGLYFTTTRNRQFIESGFANTDSLRAFPDTQKALNQYDKGLFSHHSFNDKNWPYWGETAISKKYVQSQWTREFKFIDFLELDRQNLIVVQKPLAVD